MSNMFHLNRIGKASERCVLLSFCLVLSCVSSLALTNIFAQILFATAFKLGWLVSFFVFSNIATFLIVLAKTKNGFDNAFSRYDALSFVALLIIASFIYSQYSTIIVGGQDPSIYMAYAFNLVDCESLSRPLRTLSQMPPVEINALTEVIDKIDRYAFPFNGTKIQQMDGTFHVVNDFYATPIILHTVIGYFDRDMMFYASSIISIIASLIFYFYLRLTMDERCAVAGAAILILNPAQIWFGTATYSEVISQAILFSSLLSFHASRALRSNVYSIIGLISLSSLVLLRVDNVIFPIVYVLLGLVFDLQWRWLMFLIVITALQVWLVSRNHAIYFERITADSFILANQQYILAGLGILVLMANWRKWDLMKVIRRCVCVVDLRVLGAVLCVIIVWLVAVRPNVPPFSMAMIHGKFMRTYGEDSLIRLTYVMAAPVVLIGFFYAAFSLFTLLREGKRHVLALNTMCYMPFAIVLFWESHNSPQMYWVLRRYIPILMPTLIVFCMYFFYRFSERNVPIILGMVFILLWQGYIFGSVVRHREMAGAVDSVKKFKNMYGNDAVVISDNSFRHQLFALFYYGNLDIVPLARKEIFLNPGSDGLLNKANCIMTSRDIVGRRSTCAYREDEFSFKYWRLGENYDRLPDRVWPKDIRMPILRNHGILSIEEGTSGFLQAEGKTKSSS